MMARVLLVLVLLIELNIVNASPCPDMCNGHGTCFLSECSCFDGWQGGDCSQRSCPKGFAWADSAVDVDDAHNLVVCSGRGKCDTTSGQCECDPSFTGQACEKSKCPNDCWGRGKCVNMKYNALYKKPGYGTIFKYEDVWDAERIYGCLCDQGFTGYDCSLQECPRGDDPMTTGQLDEIQLIKCSASGGFFRLGFDGATSEPIPFNTDLLGFIDILEAVRGVGSVSVTFSEVGIPVCTAALDQVVSITFLQRFGDLPSVVVDSTHVSSCSDPNVADFDLCGGTGVVTAVDGGALSPSTGSALYSVTGTKENEYCSSRGRCDPTSGVCSCYTNYVTSDGRGNDGIRGDCGFASSEIQACPGLIACSGHGVCSQSPSYKCDCSAGWTSGDCSIRTCPSGRAFFDLPISDNRAHQYAVCSNNGVCDTTTGICQCRIGFGGAACDKIDCPGSPTACSGHGECLSMAQLADRATVNGVSTPTTYGNTPNKPETWDYVAMNGCLCGDGFEGHDCSLLSCPKGDDPDTGYAQNDLQVHEVQAIRCTGDGGDIKLQFRGQRTGSIPYDSTVDQLKAFLVALSTITDINIEYSVPGPLCTDDASNVVSMTFTQELGALPPVIGFYQTDGAALTHSSGTPVLELAAGGSVLGSVTTASGTMENIECSGRGVCNHATGTCDCFDGYGSSDGSGKAGQRGDCGFKIPWFSKTTSERLYDYDYDYIR